MYQNCDKSELDVQLDLSVEENAVACQVCGIKKLSKRACFHNTEVILEKELFG